MPYVLCALLCPVVSGLFLHLFISVTDVCYLGHINHLPLPENAKIVDTLVESTDEGGDRVMARAIVETDLSCEDVAEIVERSPRAEKISVWESRWVLISNGEWPDHTYKLAERVQYFEENKKQGMHYYVISDVYYWGFWTYMREDVEMLLYCPQLLFFLDVILFVLGAEIIHLRQRKKEIDR